MNDTPGKDRKIRAGILFGGKSAEHEVSIRSARNVLDALDKDRFEPVLIGIDKHGKWHQSDPAMLLAAGENDLPKIDAAQTGLTLLPGSTDRELVGGSEQPALDVIFPILHGPMGEDGTVQGFLELANIPYVGPGVLGSAVGMDKDVMKRLLRDSGIPVTDFLVLHERDHKSFDAEAAVKKLGLPMFVKPANLGSSVGVSKATSVDELLQAVDLALQFDRKILLEKAVVGSEVECAVLGNDNPQASVPGRIIPQKDFYSYDAKYIDEDGAILEIPAKLPEKLIDEVKAMAIKTFQVLECEGMARVDMFVTDDGEIIMNEINTIPGFTKISMYPQLWGASGLSYTDLITRLIELAIERFEARQQLHTSYE